MEFTDLEILDKYIEQSRGFVPPLLFNDVRSRGLVWAINYLPGNVEEAKMVMRTRLAERGLYTGDERADRIRGILGLLGRYRKELDSMNLGETHKTIPLLEKMKELSEMLKTI
jgi:hypothetical protein